jgi:FMN phosphatase YigB (HAD superfamily)
MIGADFMSAKAIFLDFYGTLVHEDDDIIPPICEQIKACTDKECSTKDLSKYWWKMFSIKFRNSFGDTFKTQRELGLTSLAETIKHFESNCIAEEIIKPQFAHWKKPRLYEDSQPFLQELNRVASLYILSNIDTSDVMAAATYHGIRVNDINGDNNVGEKRDSPE